MNLGPLFALRALQGRRKTNGELRCSFSLPVGDAEIAPWNSRSQCLQGHAQLLPARPKCQGLGCLGSWPRVLWLPWPQCFTTLWQIAGTLTWQGTLLHSAWVFLNYPMGSPELWMLRWRVSSQLSLSSILRKKNKAMICLNKAIPDSRELLFILICKMTKSIVTFCLAKSGLKHVRLVCLALSATQSLSWMVSLWMCKPSHVIIFVWEKRKMLCRVLIPHYIWTQSPLV